MKRKSSFAERTLDVTSIFAKEGFNTKSADKAADYIISYFGKNKIANKNWYFCVTVWLSSEIRPCLEGSAVRNALEHVKQRVFDVCEKI